jgi:hypothetical protein
MRRRLRRIRQAEREKNVRTGEAGTDSQIGIASDASAAWPSEMTGRQILRQR